MTQQNEKTKQARAEYEKAEQHPVFLRIDRSISCVTDLKTYSTESHETVLQFLKCENTLQELADLEKWLGKGNAKIIFVSKKTYDQVMQHRGPFSIHYDYKGWHCTEKLTCDARNELLTAAMSVINGTGFLKESFGCFK